ncbi:MAG: TetR/AcrR family transcriptional regulator [Nitrospinota bacterium]|nr:TetR/AcrR family transcriptional regulator [Nitrospinota bacterium]
MKKEEKNDSVTEKILETARAVFAEKGFDGARVDEIAQKAGVNKATIYYHIGDKEKLYNSVIKNSITAMAESMEENAKGNEEITKKLRAHILSLLKTTGSAKGFSQLMLREVASGANRISDDLIDQMFRTFLATSGILGEGARKGELIKVEPMVLHMIIMGSTLFLHASAGLRQKVAKRKNLEQATLPIEKLAEQLADFFVDALKK